MFNDKVESLLKKVIDAIRVVNDTVISTLLPIWLITLTTNNTHLFDKHID